MPTIMDRTYNRPELTDLEQICLLDAPNFFLSIKEKGTQVYQLDLKTIMETDTPDPETPDIKKTGNLLKRRYTSLP